MERIYGNHLDEVLFAYELLESGYFYYYAHDHLYSPAALIDSAGHPPFWRTANTMFALFHRSGGELLKLKEVIRIIRN